MSNRLSANIMKRPPVYSSERSMGNKAHGKIGFEKVNDEVYTRKSSPNRSPRSQVTPPETPELDSEEFVPPVDESSYEDNKEGGLNVTNFFVGFVVVCIAVPLCVFYTKIKDSNSEISKLDEWHQNIERLQETFPSQNDNVWDNFLFGIKTIVAENPNRPSIFLLLHNDKRTSACLAQNVGKAAVQFLGDSPDEPILIKGEELKRNKSMMQDYGTFSETYRDDIMKKHVMIVLDLQEIPATLAQTFHSLCDVYNPVVHKAAYLFTMHIEKNEKLSPTAMAERSLRTLWKASLDTDIIEPLITRITDIVLHLNSEVDVPC